MAELQIACFGGLQVTLAQTALTTFPTDKARALLAYLASESQVHQRTELAQFLWAGYSAESARNNLRQTLHQLRQLLRDDAVEPPWLLLMRQTVQFNPAASIRSDVQDFTQRLAQCAAHAHAELTTCSLCLVRLRQAVELYQGNFLAGLPVIESIPFEEWRRLRQEQLRLQVLEALNQLAVAAERTGDNASALWVAQRQVAVEPQLAAQSQIMRILGGQEAGNREQKIEDRGPRAAGRGQKTEGGIKPRGEGAGDGVVVASALGGEPSLASGPLVIPVLTQAVKPPTLLDWGEMPVVDFFAGRTAEVAQLTAWLSSTAPTRIVSVLGMGGIGKTTLAAAVTKTIAPQFAVVIWRSLLNAPPLAELLRNWLQILSRQTLPTLPGSLDEQLRLLVAHLRQERCLLVLDNVESIFAADDPKGQAGVPRPGYEEYDQLLQRLASSDHQSCLLLTSREQPYALVRLGRQAQEATGRLRVLPLAGLDEQAGYALLQTNGLDASTQEAAHLIESYSGNPLALQIVAGAIADFFGGDVAAFTQEAGGLFDGIRLVLDQQFARLSPLEREILVWLAIEREVVTVQTLRTNFARPVPTRELLEALHALQNRSLLEKRDAGFTLQNVIIEYTTEYLVEQIYQEIYALRFLIDAVGSSLPVTEIEKRQSKSANLFLNRFALLKAQAKEYVRQSQVRLIVQPMLERLATHLGKAELVGILQYVIGQLQTGAHNDAGYIAGNVLNLFVQLGVDLRGYDFSGRTIRQAYLQGVTLCDVGFTNAELQGCVFTNAFGAVLSLAISADDQLLAAATNDWMVRIWQLRDGQPYQICEGHTNVVREVAFSPDRRWLASAGLDLTVRLWEVATGILRYTLKGHTAGIYSVVFCRHGQVLASAGCDSTIRLWDVNTGQLLRVLQGHTDLIHRLASDPTSGWLASGSADQTVRLWNIDTGQCMAVFQGHTNGVSCLAFSPDGVLLATGSADQTIRLWDVASRETRQVLHGHTHWVRAVAFSLDGALLASASADHTVRLWDVASGQVRGLLQGHTSAVWSLAFTADGNRLVSGGVDHQIRLWDVHNPTDSRAINVVQAHVGALIAVAVSRDGCMLATGDQNKLVRLWDVQSGQQVAILAGHTHTVRSVAFSPDGRYLVSTGNDGTVRLWDVEQRRAVQTLTGHRYHAHFVAYHPSGDFVASSGYKDGVRVWDLRSPVAARLRHLLTPPQPDQAASAWGITFSPDGRYLVSTHNDDKLYLWSVASGECLDSVGGDSNELEWIAWSPDGATLASVNGQGVIQLWDVRVLQHWQIRHTLEMGIYPWGLTFSPDSRLLASVGEDPVIRLWDVASGVCVQMLSGHTQNVTGVAFLPDSKTLVSSGYDSTLRFWNVQTGALLTTLHVPGPYAGMNITGVTGISAAQKATLRALGAVEA